MKHKFSFSQMNKRLTEVLKKRGEMPSPKLALHLVSEIHYPEIDRRGGQGIRQRKRTGELRWP